MSKTSVAAGRSSRTSTLQAARQVIRMAALIILFTALSGVNVLQAKGQTKTSNSKQTSAVKSPHGKTLNDIRHDSSGEESRVILYLSETIPYKYGFLKQEKDKPARLYIDLPDTEMSARAPRNLTVGDQAVRRVRSAYSPQNGVRVVLELQTNLPYSIEQRDKEGAELVIIIKSFSAKRPAETTASRSPSRQAAMTNRQTPAPAEHHYAQPSRSKDLASQLGLSIKTIMIDPGHGGKDPGAKGLNGMVEKEVNLRLAKALGSALAKQGFAVLYTRTNDVFISLEKRTAMANDKKADLFISLHCNAYGSQSMNGFETYYLDSAKSDDAVRVAARENGVSTREISDLQVILTDLMLNSKIKESRTLAKLINSQVAVNLKKNYSIRDHGTKGAPFYVLVGAKMPAVLIEIGYITNPADSRNMADNSYMRALASSLGRGIDEYKRQVEAMAIR